MLKLLLALMLTTPNAQAQELPARTPNLALPWEIRHFQYDRTDHALYRAFQVTRAWEGWPWRWGPSGWRST